MRVNESVVKVNDSTVRANVRANGGTSKGKLLCG